MTIYKFPEEDKVERTHHNPEFIVVDEPETLHFEEEQISSIKYLSDIKPSLGLRLFCLASSIVIGCVSVVLLGGAALFGFLSVLVLEKSSTLNNLFDKTFKAAQKMIVFTLGLFVATFSISFGFGMIILFFFLRGEAMDSEFVNRLARYRQGKDR